MTQDFPSGDKGERGPQGATGETGAQGVKGEPGEDAKDGADGADVSMRVTFISLSGQFIINEFFAVQPNHFQQHYRKDLRVNHAGRRWCQGRART